MQAKSTASHLNAGSHPLYVCPLLVFELLSVDLRCKLVRNVLPPEKRACVKRLIICSVVFRLEDDCSVKSWRLPVKLLRFLVNPSLYLFLIDILAVEEVVVIPD